MKHLTKHETEVNFQGVQNNLDTPNVALIESNGTLHYIPKSN